jgi:hypothetical protein
LRSSAVRGYRRLATEGSVVTILCLALYFTVAMIVDFKTLSFNGDAFARMANGFYVLYSRDPHVAAIGFVWNPLQSILDIGPLLFKDLWPALASHDVAGSIVSVICMTGAVHQVRAALREWGVVRAPRLAITALFAINPMILFYGANGMSEALYVFTLVTITRYLARWLRNDDARSLIYSAIALGLCYLARNEAVLPAALGGVLVLIVGFHRKLGDRRSRAMKGLTDTIIFLLPFVASFVGWAAASLVITGQPFAQFTSQYGNSAQIAAGGGAGTKFPFGQEIRLEAHALEYLAPLLVVILLVALVMAWNRRDPLVLAPLTIVGGGLAFDLAAYPTNSIIWSFRYIIAAVPIEALLVGVVLSAVPNRKTALGPHQGIFTPAAHARVNTQRREPMTPAQRWLASVVGVMVAVIVLSPSIPTTMAGMSNKMVGWQESQELGYVFDRPLTKADLADKQHYPTILRMSHYISGLHSPDGNIVVDNSSQCIPEVITNVPNPKVFVIPNDRDFQKVLADPLTFHAHYIIVPPSTGTNVNTATVKAYPTLYDTGAGFATMVHQFNPSGTGLCPTLRLYRVTGHPNLTP